ncbi:membrane protein [Azorhizobium oxalatiphilum]|uniref:Membrane protein n=1 Tax=Azorhizobium oxalatiphilum TaxID=980631 RepID=A0A917CFD5_9HYPH|nr:alpha/beta hydrolase [Azorhizobium oxalatiphilum]GGF84841.1 membrane protein [Azorhizobium oxalatiphilum]
MLRFLLKTLKRIAILLCVVLLTFLGIRIYQTERGPALEPWHTFVPHEPSIAQMDGGDWAGYLAAEQSLFESVRQEVSQKLEPVERLPHNRYFEGSPVYPPHFQTDWNRSYVLEPQGPVRGAAVLLHGLTDSPYSLRHVGRLYQQRGFVAIAPRLPGHGSVPAGLTAATWQEWMAATRLAMREARRRAGPDAPIHVVGFSNGGALALMAALDAIDDTSQIKPTRVVLISPMVGVTEFARFAGLAGLPALLPAFSKAAWLGIVPEFNPFKYNSFPVNAARQSYLLTQALQAAIRAHSRGGRLVDMPPVLTFQSALDHTVSTRAVITALHNLLADGRSELVLFDLNRNTKLDQLLRANADNVLVRLLPPTPRPFKTVIVTNRSASDAEVEARVTEAGASTEQVRPLGLYYPRDVYSLSHVALPFPMDDGLYGMEPSSAPSEVYGIQLGAIAARGERGALIVGLDTIVRMTANPFLPYLLEEIARDLPPA